MCNIFFLCIYFHMYVHLFKDKLNLVFIDSFVYLNCAMGAWAHPITCSVRLYFREFSYIHLVFFPFILKACYPLMLVERQYKFEYLFHLGKFFLNYICMQTYKCSKYHSQMWLNGIQIIIKLCFLFNVMAFRFSSMMTDFSQNGFVFPLALDKFSQKTFVKV